MSFSNRKLPERQIGMVADPDIKDALTQFLEPVRGTSVFVSYAAAVRHFVHWLRVRRIPLCDVDVSTVDRFARHKCSCPRYRPEPLRNKEYIGRVRRFVRFLEDRGYVPVPQEIEGLAVHLSSYKERLSSLGYHPCARRVLYSGAEHFSAWLRVSHLAWEDIDEDAVARFVSHDCRYGLWRKTGELSATGKQKRRRAAQRFLSYLKAEATLPPDILNASAPGILTSYRFWLRQHCGAADTTVDSYLGEMSRWLPILGDEPSAYTPRAIRDIVLQQSADRKPASIRTTATVLRSFLRFLAASNQCSPALVQAVPVTRIPRLSGLPRYAPAATIEKIIDVYEPTEVARAGTFVSIDGSGALRIERGYVRPEDEPPVAPLGDGTVEDAVDETDVGTGLVSQPESRAVASGPFEPPELSDDDEGERPIPDRLVTELTAHRTVALRDALARDPDTAFVAALHVLCLKLFYRYALDSCLEIEPKSALFGGQAPGLADTPSAKAIDTRHAAWTAQLPKEPATLWDALMAFDHDSRQALFAHCVSP